VATVALPPSRSTARMPARAYAQVRGRGLPAALLAYALVLTVLLIVPPYRTDPTAVPGFTVQEVADLLTPLVVVPLMWLVIHLAGGLPRPGMVALLLLSVVWVQGQAIHLAANAIADAGGEDLAPLEAAAATRWMDDVLSHWMWHIAWLGILGLMLVAGRDRRHVVPAVAGDGASRDGASERHSLAAVAVIGVTVAAVVHGATFFIVTVESATTVLAVPFCLAVAGAGLTWRRILRAWPVRFFLVVSAVVSLGGYAWWAALNGGELPEFSKVGWF
jgi:hypothetical protein